MARSSIAAMFRHGSEDEEGNRSSAPPGRDPSAEKQADGVAKSGQWLVTSEERDGNGGDEKLVSSLQCCVSKLSPPPSLVRDPIYPAERDPGSERHSIPKGTTSHATPEPEAKEGRQAIPGKCLSLRRGA